MGQPVHRWLDTLRELTTILYPLHALLAKIHLTFNFLLLMEPALVETITFREVVVALSVILNFAAIAALQEHNASNVLTTLSLKMLQILVLVVLVFLAIIETIFIVRSVHLDVSLASQVMIVMFASIAITPDNQLLKEIAPVKLVTLKLGLIFAESVILNA